MNEQINQLAKQACDYAFRWAESDSIIDPKITPKQWIETYTQKFAELIVRECAQVAEEVDGDSRARKCVLKHFGIEE